MGVSRQELLEWVVISYSKGSSLPRDWTCISCIGKRILYHWAICEAWCSERPKWTAFWFYDWHIQNSHTIHHIQCIDSDQGRPPPLLYLKFLAHYCERSFFTQTSKQNPKATKPQQRGQGMCRECTSSKCSCLSTSTFPTHHPPANPMNSGAITLKKKMLFPHQIPFQCGL